MKIKKNLKNNKKFNQELKKLLNYYLKNAYKKEIINM